MRILLIDPPHDRLIGFKSEWFPLGLTCLASFLRERGYEDVSIYHAEHEPDIEYTSIVNYAENFHRYKEAIDSDDHPIWDEVRQQILTFDPDLVGITVLTIKLPAAFRIARICKEIDPEIRIVFGGHHPTVRPNEVLSSEDVDFVVRGEGEETLCELLKVIPPNGMNFHDVPGLSFRMNGKTTHNPGRGLIEDINGLSLPARDSIIDYETYSPVQFSMMMTSRGCPYDCGFCASGNIWSRRVRFRSIDSILEEIEELKTRYDIRNITFMDDAFTISRGRVTKLCQAFIANRIDITWSCLTRVDIISDELVTLMKKAGCTKVSVGVESGNQRILDLIGKNITLERIRDAVGCLRKNKMFWSGFFMFGFPTETEDEVFDTLNFLHELKPDWAHIGIFTPYPGTALHELAMQNGMITSFFDYTQYSHHNLRSRRTDTIGEERFYELGNHMLHEVHRYNRSYKSLIKRALTRNYHKNPKLMYQDLCKLVTWIKT